MRNMEGLLKYAINKENYDIKRHGEFEIPITDNKHAFVICSKNSMGWDHVSLHITEASGEPIKRTPSNEDMQFIRNLLFLEDEIVTEFHPAKKDYINNHPYVLHMWHSTNDCIEIPTSVDISKIKSKTIQLPQNHQISVRQNQDDSWIRINVRTMNKRGNLAKRYPSWEEMCMAKKIYFDEEEACVQFRDKEMNEDFSIDIYKPIQKKLICPPSILVGVKKFGKLA